MLIFINAFLIGTASGLRALIGLAAVSWAAHLGILSLDHTWLAFLGNAFTPYILTLLAIGELINDKLPKSPSRLIPPQFIARIVTGALCGLAIGLSRNGLIIGLVAGIIGALAGTFGGAKVRSLLAKTFGRDLPAALLEDANRPWHRSVRCPSVAGINYRVSRMKKGANQDDQGRNCLCHSSRLVEACY